MGREGDFFGADLEEIKWDEKTQCPIRSRFEGAKTSKRP
jgi:hypothetical protein